MAVQIQVVREVLRQLALLDTEMTDRFRSGDISAAALVTNFREAVVEDALSCDICMSRPVDARIHPCMHKGCYQCLKEIKEKRGGYCPTCRKLIEDIIRAMPPKNAK